MPVLALLVILVLAVACESDDDGSDGAGTGSASAGSAGAIDCSDDDFNQSLVCGDGDICCGQMDAPNTCAASCDQGVAFDCDGAEDCDGTLCCYAPPGGGAGTSCTDTCDQPVCHSSTDCPVDVPCCLPATINGVTLTFCGDWGGAGCL